MRCRIPTRPPEGASTGAARSGRPPAGRKRQTSTMPRSVSTPIPANAARQPNACPAAVPTGTPSTNARLPPPTVSATARPMSAGGTRCAE